MGKGDGRREGQNDRLFNEKAEAAGWPPPSPNLRTAVDAAEDRRAIDAVNARYANDPVLFAKEVLRVDPIPDLMAALKASLGKAG